MGLFSRDQDEEDVTVTGPARRKRSLFSKEGFQRFAESGLMAANNLYRDGAGNDAITKKRAKEEAFARAHESAMRIVAAADANGTSFDPLTRQAVLEGDPDKIAEILGRRLAPTDLSEGETHVQSPWMRDPKEQERIYAPKTLETNAGDIVQTNGEGGVNTVRPGTTAGTADRRAYVMEVTGVDIGNPQWGAGLPEEKKNEVMRVVRDFALHGQGPTAIEHGTQMNREDNATSRANTQATIAGAAARDTSPQTREQVMANIANKVAQGQKLTAREVAIYKALRAEEREKRAHSGRPAIDASTLLRQLD